VKGVGLFKRRVSKRKKGRKKDSLQEKKRSPSLFGESNKGENGS